jgi:hypothetical protein
MKIFSTPGVVVAEPAIASASAIILAEAPTGIKKSKPTRHCVEWNGC